jgi:hypothetical protein
LFHADVAKVDLDVSMLQKYISMLWMLFANVVDVCASMLQMLQHYFSILQMLCFDVADI